MEVIPKSIHQIRIRAGVRLLINELANRNTLAESSKDCVPFGFRKSGIREDRVGMILIGTRTPGAGRPSQREAQVRRQKPAVGVDWWRSRVLRSKCNHDRRLLAGCVGSRTAASEQRNLDCRCKPELSGSWTSTGSLEELQLQLHSSNRRAAPTLTLPVNDRSLWPVRGVRRRRSIVCPESRGSSRERAGPKPTDVHRHSQSPDHSMHSA